MARVAVVIGLSVVAGLAQRPAVAGCGVPLAIANTQIGSPGAGGFDLAKTAYATNAERFAAPGIRFWAFGHYADANNGTQKQTHPEGGWVVQPKRDFDVKELGSNVYSLYQPNWMGSGVTGCVLQYDETNKRTVVEMSFPDASKEGTTAHQGFYAAASVDFQVSFVDFDRVTGAGGKAGNIVPVEPIPAPVVTAAPAPSAAGTQVSVTLAPLASYSEGGLDKPVKLIRGYRLLYATGAEPTSSDPSKYLPVRDPKDPTKELGTLAPGAATVLIPEPAKTAWLVAQVVYEDPSDLRSLATSAHAGLTPDAGGGRTRGTTRGR